MSRLLRSDFSRLIKSRIFWTGIIYAAGMGILVVTTQYREMHSIDNYRPHIDDVLFSLSLFMPIVAAVFTGIFTGTDYSNGTIRNKLIVGHKRTAIYFSNLIVNTAAIIVFHIVSIVMIIAVGVPLVGNVRRPASQILTLCALSIVTMVAISAFCLMISMLISSKTNASVVSILIAVILLMAGMTIYQRLCEPEYYPEYEVTVYDEEGGSVPEETLKQEKNPHYLTGTKREVYEFLLDFLPNCQLMQISGATEVPSVTKLPLYSLSIAIVTTGCGVFFLRRKNIK